MSAADLVGGTLPPFLILTLVFFGGAAAMTGHALARNWRPAAQLVFYALLLAGGDRFLLYSLFGATLLSATGFVLAAVLLLAIGLLSFRATRARRMALQYPWLYRRRLIFFWQERQGPASSSEAVPIGRLRW